MEWEVTWNGWVDWGDGNSHAACTYNSVTCVRRGGDMHGEHMGQVGGERTQPCSLCELNNNHNPCFLTGPRVNPAAHPQTRSPPNPCIQCEKMMTGNVQFEKCLARLTSRELGKRKRSWSCLHSEPCTRREELEACYRNQNLCAAGSSRVDRGETSMQVPRL